MQSLFYTKVPIERNKTAVKLRPTSKSRTTVIIEMLFQLFRNQVLS